MSALKNHGGPDGVLVAEVKVALVLIGGTAVVKVVGGPVVVKVMGRKVVTVKTNVLVTVGAPLSLQREPPEAKTPTATFILDNNGTNRYRALVE